MKGKITSLELLQQHAMGKDNKHLGAWLESVRLDNNNRLAEFLDVQSGWEVAVETVLGSYLEAICLENAEQVIPDLHRLGHESISLFETGAGIAAEPTNKLSPLLDRISAPWNLSPLLTGVYCADNHETARALSLQLKPYESIITPDGTWFGPGWIKIQRAKDSKAGVLQREKELRLLKQRQDELQIEIAGIEDALENTEAGLKDAEIRRESISNRLPD